MGMQDPRLQRALVREPRAANSRMHGGAAYRCSITNAFASSRWRRGTMPITKQLSRIIGFRASRVALSLSILGMTVTCITVAPACDNSA